MHLSDDRPVGARVRISADAELFDAWAVTKCNSTLFMILVAGLRGPFAYITAPSCHGTNSFWP